MPMAQAIQWQAMHLISQGKKLVHPLAMRQAELSAEAERKEILSS